MIFLFLIIFILSVFSGYYLNKLSDKTGAILNENYVSLVYSREMSAGLTKINQEISTAFITKKYCDNDRIAGYLSNIDKFLTDEKNNITEPGEDRLVSEINAEFSEYGDSVQTLKSAPVSARAALYIQSKTAEINSQLLILSQMNGKALEVKTNDAKATSKSALTKMTILATFCFLIGFTFTFSFATYFNQRFILLYNGIKEMVASNFNQHLYYSGQDEFYEISLVFNEMADKLRDNDRKMSVTLSDEEGKELINENLLNNDVYELKNLLVRLKALEEKASALLTRFERK